MTRDKGWLIKQSFPNDFVDTMTEIYKKYGESIFEIQGIANSHMDINKFSKNFFSKSTNVADISIDGNANVREKNISQYKSESNKSISKLNSLYLLYKYVKKNFSIEDAKIALEKVINGEVFINDLTNFDMPYCYAFDLRTMLTEGLNFFKGNMTIKKPKRSDSFMNLLIQATAFISNQIMGAVSYPDFFPVLDWFYRKEMGEDYMKSLSKDSTEYLKIKNQFQNLIYSLNWPFRGSQSAFTNLSVMDKGFMESLFKDYTLPDFTTPNLDSSLELSKIFFEYFSEINTKEGIFTFPVMTMAISLDENNEYIDPDFVDWSAKINCEKSLANVFQDVPTSFSSCCRLKNDLTKVAEAGFQNSFGVSGLSIGSLRVAGLNLPRLSILEKDNPKAIDEALDTVHKILYAHRQLINKRVDDGFLPLYTAGWIHTTKQYSTVGFVGGYEYVKNKGMDIATDKGTKALQDVLLKIEKTIVDWQEKEKAEKILYNVEEIPAEAMAVRLADIDFSLGYNSSDIGEQKIRTYDLYSNQYIPLIDNASIYDRIRVQGQFDSLTSGGAILHINADDSNPVPYLQYKKIMNTNRILKSKYFAINYAYSECEDGHFPVGKHEVCPICSKDIIQQFGRVVGFIVPVKSWNYVRKTIEYPNRVFYTNKQIEEANECL